MKVLEIYTFNENGVGGVSSMVTTYLNAAVEFANNDCILSLLNVKPSISTGKSMIDNFLYIFTQRLEVIKHLKVNKYDVVHIHTSREFLFLKDVLLGETIKKHFHIPVVLTVHVGDKKTVYNRIKWFKYKSISIINRYIDKVIFLSEAMRKDFIKEGLKENLTFLLYNFYNFTPTNYKIEKKNNVLQLLFVGAIHREKGIIELLNALSEMPTLNYHLNVCGQLKDNSIKDKIEHFKNLLSDKVSFLGLVMGEDKTKIYMKSDILILPSYHEGLPLVIMEALGTGCGIMTTPVGAIPEILNDENCRWLEIGSYKSIVSQLTNLTNDDLNRMKEANINLGKKYSLKSHVNYLCNIYKSVMLLPR